MEEEIFINATQGECRIAIAERGLLRDIFIERTHNPRTIGNIYKGKVTRVLPGMDSAFIDIGNERDAFIHIKDLLNSASAIFTKDNFKYTRRSISEILHEGQELLVQVTKEPSGTKSQSITSNISLASRYLVYMPYSSQVVISQRIEDQKERERLKDAILSILKNQDGFIVRTAAENVDIYDIYKDAKLLIDRWSKVLDKSKKAIPPAQIYKELPLPLRVVRDTVGDQTTRIRVDRQETMDSLESFIAEFIPSKSKILELAINEEPIFDIHKLEDQISSAIDQRVPLKSGGYLVIEQTEAMTTIDVNTGVFVGRKDHEETIFKTNLEAASLIPWQLRLRNVGGVVVIDFIDMGNEAYKEQVLRTLEKGQQTDRVKWNLSQISDFGLVELTRKRDGSSLVSVICEPCECCRGRGFVKTADTVCLEILNEIRRRAGRYKEAFLITASESIVDELINSDPNRIDLLSKALGIEIQLRGEASYNQEQFDVIGLSI